MGWLQNGPTNIIEAQKNGRRLHGIDADSAS